MAITKLKCPTCGKILEEKLRSRFFSNTLITYKCGHILSEKEIVNLQKDAKLKPSDIVSVDGKKLFPFQQEAIELGAKSNFNCLFEYQMGLGKTPITDAALNLFQEDLLPALLVAKGSVTWQHFKELIRWNGGLLKDEPQDPINWTSQVISESNMEIFPIFKVYITSYDMLRRLDVEDFKAIGLKTVILDECQKIANHKSKRSSSLREFIDTLGIKHKIALSGTPIKNNPGEFFSILNLLHPEMFPSKKQFENRWLDFKLDKRTGKYKVSGIRNIEEFHKLTSSFIFRKTREEVKDQIGLTTTEAFRDFKYIDIDTDIKKGYKKAEDEFSDFFTQHELEGSAYTFEDYSHILALFARMRHLAGLSKVSWSEEFISEWLSSRCLTTDDLVANEDLPDKEKKLEPKLAIFTHHIDVAQFLMNCVRNICEVENYDWKPLYLPSGLDSGKQDDIQNDFNFGPNRILVASTLGSGEGINLQHNCSDAVMMERQWNPANEEQAESRFIRIGQKADLVTVTYPTVLGTIDEYFTELVEKKRNMLQSIKSGKEQVPWDEQETVLELASQIIKKRAGKRWSY